MKNVTINKSQKLYVLHGEKYISCLGFQVCLDKRDALNVELDVTLNKGKLGSVTAYKEYLKLVDIAKVKFDYIGVKSKIELEKQLIGLEGKRIEVIDSYGETRRFIVGKSSGWMPCHLEIKKRNSSGGGQVYGTPFKSIKII